MVVPESPPYAMPSSLVATWWVSGTTIKKKLNEQLDIKGGVTNESELTENNIGVISKNNILNVRLAKNLRLHH